MPKGMTDWKFSTSNDVPYHVRQFFDSQPDDVIVKANNRNYHYPKALLKPQVGIIHDCFEPPFMIDLDAVFGPVSKTTKQYLYIHDSLLNLSSNLDQLSSNVRENGNLRFAIKIIDFMDLKILKRLLNESLSNTFQCSKFFAQYAYIGEHNQKCSRNLCYHWEEGKHLEYHEALYNELCSKSFSCAVDLARHLAVSKRKTITKKLDSLTYDELIEIYELANKVEEERAKKRQRC